MECADAGGGDDSDDDDDGDGDTGLGTGGREAPRQVLASPPAPARCSFSPSVKWETVFAPWEESGRWNETRRLAQSLK